MSINNTTKTINTGESSDTFSVQRVFGLVKHFVSIHQKGLRNGALLTIGFFSAIILLIYIFDGNTTSSPAGNTTGYLQLYLLLGCLFTSRIFAELHKSETGWLLLSLPASNLEKFTAAWLVTFLGYTLVAIATIATIVFISTLASLMTTSSLPSYTISGGLTIRYLLYYLFLNSYFLWGGLFFTRYSFILSGIGFILLFILSLLLFLSILYFSGQFENALVILITLVDSFPAILMLVGMYSSLLLLLLYSAYDRFTKMEMS